MRILWHAPTPLGRPAHGASLADASLVSALVARGHAVGLLTSKREVRSSDRIPAGVDLVSGWGTSVAPVAERWQADVVVFQQPQMAWVGQLVKSRIPAVAILHGDACRRVAALGHRVSLVICCAEYLAEELRAEGLRCVVVHPQIAGLPDPVPPVTFASVVLCPAVTRKKGADVVLDVARLLPDVRFGLVQQRGEEAEEGLRARARRLENVEWIPGPLSLPDLIARTRVLLFPSLTEGYGMAPREAALCGRPVVSRGLPGPMEAIGAAGVYVDGADPAPWAAAVRAVLAWDTVPPPPRVDRGAEIATLDAALLALVPRAAPLIEPGPKPSLEPEDADLTVDDLRGPFPQGCALHLGAGGKAIAGYVNTDVRRDQAPSGVVVDVQKTPLPPRRFRLIYACHLLEHLYPEETVPALRRWLQALEYGGTVRLSVPDLRLVVANCVEDPTKFGPNPDAPLFGDFRQQAPEWDRHKRCFTKEILTRLIEEAGYVNVRSWAPNQYPEIAAVKDWSSWPTISLNLEADRPQPISLNLEADRPQPVAPPPLPGGPTPEEASAKAERCELSVIIGTYNRQKMLRDFVASVRSSLGSPPVCSYEIVVTDGGSTDGTLKWLEAQPDVRVLHGGLTGAIDAFNAAYAASRGELVMHANDDTEVVGDSAAVAVRHLREHPEDAQVVFKWSRDGGKQWKHDGGGKRPPHPNQAVTRRLALEDTIAHELGAFWGDEDHRTDKTYGGDTYQWAVLARREWRAVSLGDQCRILDKMHDATGPLRARNTKSVGPGSRHGKNFRGMSRIGLPGCWDLQLPRDRWPFVYVAEPGRPPRRSPISAGPEERVLVLHMGWGPEPLTGLRRAFSRIGPYEEVAWVDALRSGGPEAIRAAVLAAAGRVRPTLVWVQIQRPGQWPAGPMAELRKVAPPDCLLVAWNGDVRTSGTQPMEPWQAQFGRQVDLYLVSNCTQPAMLAAAGVPRAGYLPVGYDPELSNYRRDAEPQEGEDGVVFAGQNYHQLDGGYRRRLFEAVEAAHPGCLSLFGGGWGQSPALQGALRGFVHQEPLSYIYSRARGAVACSLFTDLRRYTSDRLKRMLGCGAVTAMRAFDDYEGLGIRDGVHALVWRDEQDLVELLGDWLRPERDVDRPPIREAAHRLARETMTWDVVVENLLAIVRAERHRRATSWVPSSS